MPTKSELEEKLTTLTVHHLFSHLSYEGYTLTEIGGGGGTTLYWINEIHEQTHFSIPWDGRTFYAEIRIDDNEKECKTVGDALEFLKQYFH